MVRPALRSSPLSTVLKHRRGAGFVWFSGGSRSNPFKHLLHEQMQWRCRYTLWPLLGKLEKDVGIIASHAGMALVPFADAFNHKASIMSLSSSYEIQGTPHLILEERPSTVYMPLSGVPRFPIPRSAHSDSPFKHHDLYGK